MNRENWYNKSINERLYWYRQNIESIANYLELKEPFSYQDIAHYLWTLGAINGHLHWDAQLAESKVKTTKKELSKYFQITKNLGRQLPGLETDQEKWIPLLYKSLNSLTTTSVKLLRYP